MSVNGHEPAPPRLYKPRGYGCRIDIIQVLSLTVLDRSRKGVQG